MSCKPILPSEFNIKNYSLKAFQTNSKKKDLYISFPNYKQKSGNSGLTFQTGWIELNHFGIPSAEYVKTDEERAILKAPLYEEDSGELIEMLTKIDTHTKNEFVKLLSGDVIDSNLIKNYKQPEKMSYCGLVREPHVEVNNQENQDDAEEQKPTKPKYIKAKFDIDYGEESATTKKKSSQIKIKTGVFVRMPDPNNPTKTIVERKPLTNINAIADLVTFKSKVRMVISVSKLWLMKATDLARKYKYGYTVIIKQIEVEPREATKAIQPNFEQYVFRDNDDNNTVNNNTGDNDNEEEEKEKEDDNDDANEDISNESVVSENDSESEEKQPKKKAPVKKNK